MITKQKIYNFIEFGLILILGCYVWLVLATILKATILFIIETLFELNSAYFEGGLISLLSLGVVLAGFMVVINRIDIKE